MTLAQDAPIRSRFAPARETWRSLLVHVQPEASARPRLEAAADLARKLDARLVGVGAETIPPMAVGDPTGMLGDQFVALIEDSIQANLKTAGDAFEAQTSGENAAWVTVEALPARAVARLARAADLVIAGGAPLEFRDPYRWCDPAELVLHCGCPVLVVPPEGGKLDARSVVVAWKDTREARRALADSLPILKCAEAVLVVSVCPKEEAEEAELHTASVVDYLTQHGVRAQAKIVAADEHAAAREVQACADEAGADLIVAGAYGRTRLGEWVFGGVTRDLLQNPRRFLLLSH